MPVDDHPVHPSTVKTTAHAGCYNREPFKAGYYVSEKVVSMHGTIWVSTWIPHRMTTTCQSTQENYPECAGCQHKELSDG